MLLTRTEFRSLKIPLARSRYSLNFVVAHKLLANQVSQLCCSLVRNFALLKLLCAQTCHFLCLRSRKFRFSLTGLRPSAISLLEIPFARSRYSLNFVVAHKLLANQVSQLCCSLVRNFACIKNFSDYNIFCK